MVDIQRLRELLRRSVLTLAAVPDSDLRYRLGPRTAWPEFVRHARDAYGSAPPRFRTFHPTRQDLSIYLEALSWLAWYRRNYGEETVRVFIGWCFGAAMWQLQERVSTNRRRPASPRTVHNRMDAMVLAVAVQFPEAQGHVLTITWNCRSLPVHTSRVQDYPRMCVTSLSLPRVGFRRACFVVPDGAGVRSRALEKQLRRNGSRALKRASKPLG